MTLPVSLGGRRGFLAVGPKTLSSIIAAVIAVIAENKNRHRT
jgi:hypothetical protein